MHNFYASHSCGFFQSSLYKVQWQIREMDGALFADSKDYLCVVYGLTRDISSFERQHLVSYIFLNSNNHISISNGLDDAISLCTIEFCLNWSTFVFGLLRGEAASK